MLCWFLMCNQLYVYMNPHPSGPPSHHTPIPPSRSSQGTGLSPRALQQPPESCGFTPGNVLCVLPNLSFQPTIPLPPMSMSVLYICLSIPALKMGSPLPFF